MICKGLTKFVPKLELVLRKVEDVRKGEMLVTSIFSFTRQWFLSVGKTKVFIFFSRGLTKQFRV